MKRRRQSSSIKQKKLRGFLPIARSFLMSAMAIFSVYFLFTLKTEVIQGKTTSNSTPSPAETKATEKTDFRISIPSLELNAPVIADVNGADQTAYNKALENGVAQLQGSAKPGEGSNIFIFGHSSYYWWKPGGYKTIFSQLPKIKKGATITLNYHQKEFNYRVSEIKIVLPTEVDVIKKTSAEQLSLMTCYPIGSTAKRMVVIAKPE